MTPELEALARRAVALEALARRAVACPRWRWMPGMRATHRHCSPIRVLVRDDGEGYECYIVAPGPDGNEVQCIDECGVMGSFPSADGSAYPVLPDLADPATLGCLLALVREAWGCDEWRRLTVEPAGECWCLVLRNARHRPPSRAHGGWDLDAVAHHRYVSEMHSGPFGRNEFALEAEALVHALEAAP
jgi:hypothetical protein